MLSKPLIAAFIVSVVLFSGALIINSNNNIDRTILYFNTQDEKRTIELALHYNRELYRKTSEAVEREKIREDSEWLSQRQAYIWLFDNFKSTIRIRLVMESITFSALFFIVIGILYVFFLKRYSDPIEALSKSLEVFTSEGSICNVKLRGPRKLQKILKNFNRLLLRLYEKTETEKLINSLKNWQNGASIVLHEIKNKLTPLSLALGVLSEDIIPGTKLSNSIQGIQNKIQGIETLVWKFRELSQLPEPVPKMLALKELILVITKTNRLENYVDLTEIQNSLNIFSDPVFIEIIIVNLLKNAIDSNKGSEEKVKLVLKENCLEIHDKGCGIPSEKISKIFKPGYTTKNNGFGMGLFIVQELCRILNIGITLDSCIGRGTTFYLDFKYADSKNSHS